MNGSKLLKTKVDGSGYKIRFIAEQLGLTYQGFVNKINDIAKFRANEIAILCDLLKISDDERNAIFFDQYVDGQSTNNERSE
ncbi:hypothetical protein SDC9_166277 [bioreactor metagenome]|uniref:HTH cro/C1-type domain-containing protein n=1 Tax=bioreactor metagenome TaxID=1076179 RepID=A0A645FYX2_9ZZZZ|nr:toxin-antitoxin system, antitoxin component, Xre family protein [Candidatus Fimivivens sp.]